MKQSKRHGTAKERSAGASAGRGATALWSHTNGTHVESAEAPARGGLPWWAWATGVLFLVFVAFEAYNPALNGPLIFDDPYLPFASPDFVNQPLVTILKNQRPLLMLGFWLQVKAFGLNVYSLHLVNVIFHLITSVLAWLIVRRLAAFAGQEGWKREAIAAFCGAVFLLHPLQTESAAYIASRSETQSVMFLYAAFAFFLYCGPPLPSFARAFLVLLLFAPAVLTKEHAAVLPAVLLLTDYYWNPGFSLQGIRRNWRLYAPMALGGIASLGFVWAVLRAADTAGFSVKGIPWYQYMYTQFRVFWVYIRLFVFPAGQNIDWGYPISRSLFEPLTLLGFIALLAAAGVAFHYRRRYPLASFGFFVFVFLLAPTSSIVPIKDALAERRTYLPMIGLLCILADVLWRWKAPKEFMAGAMAAVLAIFGYATWQRNHLWADPIALWQDAVDKAPRNDRAHFQLAFAHYQANNCSTAASHYETASKLAPVEPRLLVDWALALDCAGRPEDALAKLNDAAKVQPDAHVWSLIGMVHGKQGHREQAMEAVNRAIRLDPSYEMSYVYRGNLYNLEGDVVRAAADYQAALARNPSNEVAREALAVLRQRVREGR